MKNKKGFTLIELLAVIVVLAIVMVLATTTVLPYMSTAREDAFKIEATYAVEGAKNAMNLYTLGEITLDNTSTDKCIDANHTHACFTIGSLINEGVYNADPENFAGRVDVTIDKKSNSYTLYFRKGAEFSIEGLSGDNFNKDDIKLTTGLDTQYETCKCSGGE